MKDETLKPSFEKTLATLIPKMIEENWTSLDLSHRGLNSFRLKY